MRKFQIRWWLTPESQADRLEQAKREFDALLCRAADTQRQEVYFRILNYCQGAPRNN